jgi:O-antigen ligase
MSSSTRREVPIAAVVLAAFCLPVLMLHFAMDQILVLMAGVVFLVVTFSLPNRWLPSLALAIFTLVPLQYMSVPTKFTYITPALVVLVIWQARGRLTQWTPAIPVSRRAFQALSIALAFSIICSWLNVQSLPGYGGHEFIISFIALAVLLPVASCGYSAGLSEVGTTWTVLGGALGVYAVVEKFVLHSNPLFDGLYSAGLTPIVQDWSTYRATTSLGHPLLNATYFSIAVLFGAGGYMAGRKWLLYPALLSVAGLVSTVSRSGVLALGAGVLVCLATGTFRASIVKLRTTLTVLVVLGLSAAVAQPLLNARSSSSEGAVSSQYRDLLRTSALQAFHEHPLLGFGPGGLPSAAAAGGLNTGGDFENSWIEFVLAHGIIGTALLALVVGFSIIRAYRSGNLGLAGALTSYSVSMSAFNLLPAYLPAHLLLGLLLAMANAPSTPRARAPSTSDPATTRLAAAVRKPTATNTPEISLSR